MSDFDDKATVTGAIASFNNGADEVPVDSGTFYIQPSQSGTGTPSPSNPRPLVGYTGMTITKAGKNLLENQETSRTESDVTFTVNSDGSVSLSGTATAEINFTVYSNFTFPKLGNYVISGCPSGGSTSTYRIFATNYGSDTGSGLSVNVTNLSTKTSVRINIKSGTNTNGLTFKPMIETGSTATAYSAFTSETLSVSWQTEAGTVYGGSRKTDGTLTETWGYHKVTSSETSIDFLAGTNNNGYRIGFDIANAEAPKYSGCLSNCFENKACLNSASWTIGAFCIYGTMIYIVCPNDCDTSQKCIDYLLSVNAEFAYPLATPNEYSLSPISLSTYYGDNNVWCDTGDSEVTYYKSGYGFTSVTVNQKDGNDELIATKTAKLHRIIYGGEVDVIKGTAKPKNLLKVTDGTYTIGNTGASATISNGSVVVTGTTTNSGGRTTRLSDYFILKAGTYMLSPVLSTSPYVRSYLNKKSDNTVVGYSSGNSFTVEEDVEVYFGINVESGYTYDATITPQLEIGTSITDYAPYFEPFTFTPISMETVEGLNVLYANEGDSTITYRKSAD